MILKSITIYRRPANYSGSVTPSDPFDAMIQVEGQYGEVKLKLGAELCQRVVAIIADEIVNAGREVAQAMTAQALEITPAPQLETADAP